MRNIRARVLPAFTAHPVFGRESLMRVLRSVLMGAAAAVLISTTATAATTGTIVLGDSFGYGSGGEFKVTAFSGMPVVPAGPNVNDVGSLFQTFCLETTELVGFGGTFHWVLNNKAVNGGAGGGSPDPISPQTAYLYTQFYGGTLSNYDYTNSSGDRINDGGDLQRAFWHFENEITTPVSSLPSETQAWIAEANGAVSGGSWSGIGNVRVLNLYYDSAHTRVAQDQLVMVPLPASAWLMLPLLGGLGALRLARRRAA